MRQWIALILLLFPYPAFAWNAKGHRIVAMVAERRLATTSPDSLKRALVLLGERHLANVAARADKWATKPGTAHTAPWHFVSIPSKQDTYVKDRDCPHSGCLVDTVVRLREIVGDSSLDRLQRKEALIYLIHLIGEIFQPWHCTNGTLRDGSSDANGTRVRITYKGGHLPGNHWKDSQDDNVHFLWDVSLLEFERRNETAMVEHLFADTVGGRNPNYINNTETMANYAHSIVRDSKGAEGGDLSESDMQFNAGYMDEQLVQAGLELERIIRLALSPQQSPNPLESSSSPSQPIGATSEPVPSSTGFKLLGLPIRSCSADGSTDSRFAPESGSVVALTPNPLVAADNTRAFARVLSLNSYAVGRYRGRELHAAPPKQAPKQEPVSFGKPPPFTPVWDPDGGQPPR